MIQLRLYSLIILCFVSSGAIGQSTSHIDLFRLQDVKLYPGIFQDAEATDLKYILALNPDRLLAPYQREAGLPQKADSYGNWENTGLDGHIGGHYLSALSMMYATTGNVQVLERLEYMIEELRKCQEAIGDGYVGGVPGSRAYWREIFRGNLDLQSKKWVPLYNVHKTYAGLRDAYQYTGNKTAKAMLIKFSDWFVTLSGALGVQKMEEMLRVEHGGINEVLADVYAITGDKKYLDAAYSFSHKSIVNPLADRQDELNGLHANTQIPKVIGFKRIADLNNDTTYNRAAHFFWETVIRNRTVAIGGNSVREHFHPSDDFRSMITSEQGPETCNTYNMLKLTAQLYRSDGLVKYIDYYERALYNHILSSQLPGKGGFVYFTPMRPGHYRVYSQPETSMWCCVGSGMENHAKYGELIYAHDKENLYVNLFIPSEVTWREKGISLKQVTNFPEEQKTKLTIQAETPTRFSINIRYPSWVAKDLLKVRVNGKPFNLTSSSSSYVSISRRWKNNDTIEVELPMQIKTEQFPDGLNYVAVLYGPIVLAAKTDSTDMSGLLADESRMAHVADGPLYPLHQQPMFVTDDEDVSTHINKVAGKSLTFRAEDMIYPSNFDALELIPFYKLHSSRYVIYWQRETKETLQGVIQKIKKEEEDALTLASITVDVIKAGEQQPEADHFIESENSRTGRYEDSWYRDARGWFGYKMINKGKLGNKLRVTYRGRDKDRRFRILVNNQIIATVTSTSRPDTFYSVEYPIPAEILTSSNEEITVRFEAEPASVAGAVFEVRLIK